MIRTLASAHLVMVGFALAAGGCTRSDAGGSGDAKGADVDVRGGDGTVVATDDADAAATGGGAPDTATKSGDAGGGQLDIYWIDVEGGAATLLVAPTGQTLLVDGGFPGNNDRDLNRILDIVSNRVHATKLDYVITTHFHSDHVGGVTSLAARFPVGQFIDHGASVEAGGLYTSYLAAMAGKTRLIIKPGERLQLGAEVELVFVSSGGQLVDSLPTAAANPDCDNAPQKPERPGDENPQSVGFVARFGRFDFVDLGDLTWAVESRLACPTNRIGPIDLLQISHHGLDLSSPPQLVRGLAPRVAVMNNGPTKGGAASTFETVKASPGLQDLWAMHRAVSNDAEHNAVEALTANIATAPDAAHFIKASVARDGSYTVTNSRNGTTRSYLSR